MTLRIRQALQKTARSLPRLRTRSEDRPGPVDMQSGQAQPGGVQVGGHVIGDAGLRRVGKGDPAATTSPLSRSPVGCGQQRRVTYIPTAAQRGTGSLPVGNLRALKDQLFGPPQRPGWFDSSIARILRQGDAVMTATSPRELEQVTAELTGGEVHWTLREMRKGLWFEWWFRELARAAGGARQGRSGPGWWRVAGAVAAAARPCGHRLDCAPGIRHAGGQGRRQRAGPRPRLHAAGFRCAPAARSPEGSGRCATATAPGSRSSPSPVPETEDPLPGSPGGPGHGRRSPRCFLGYPRSSCGSPFACLSSP